MLTPRIFIAYTPRGAGLLGAAAWLEEERDVHGWFVGAIGYEARAAYFKLANFFSTEPTLFYATDADDLYAGWKFDYSSGKKGQALEPPIKVNDATCHQLAQLQEAFRNEWLFYADDPASAHESERYRELSLPVQKVNVKAAKLNKLARHDVIWTYYSHAAERVVVDYLLQHWPLDYQG